MSTFAKIALGVSILIGLGIGVVLFGRDQDRRQGERLLAKAEARARALGIPIHADEMVGEPVPDNENAWIDLLKEHELLKDLKDEDAHLGDLLSLTDRDEYLAKSKPKLAIWAPLLRLGEEAARKSAYAPKRDWRQGFAMLQPDLATIKKLVRAFVARSRSQLLTGDRSGAQSSLNTAILIARMLDQEQTMMGALVVKACDAIVGREIVKQASYSRTEKSRSSLRKLLNELFPAIDIKRVVHGETLLYLEWVRNVSDNSELGNKLRSEVKNDDNFPHGINSDFALPPQKARYFEGLAIHVACDFYEGLKPRIEDYEANDAAPNGLYLSELTWVIAGYPMKWVNLGHQLSMGESMFFRECARTAVSAESHSWAFDIACDVVSPRAGEVRQSQVVKGATITYGVIEGGFSLRSQVRAEEPITLKFVLR